jgi:hypothetical protein
VRLFACLNILGLARLAYRYSGRALALASARTVTDVSLFELSRGRALPRHRGKPASTVHSCAGNALINLLGPAKCNSNP